MEPTISGEELLFFDRTPQGVPLYAAFREAVAERWPETAVRVQKSQITYVNRHVFACASLARRRWKGFPEAGLLVTLGLNRRLSSPRVAVAVEPYPGRWTHHIPISRPEEIDGELLAWVEEAYQFALSKR